MEMKRNRKIIEGDQNKMKRIGKTIGKIMKNKVRK
jgi:hypothetical protein